MNPARQRLQDDLREVITGDVLCDEVSLQLYACDASIYEVQPLAVIRPRQESDVVATVRYAAEQGLSVHPRGAGSGLAGESLGPGIILDFSRYFKRIIDSDETTVRVEAGVVLGSLNRYLAEAGMMFGPDPAMSQVTTMGSVIAIDAAGSHWLQHGSARDKVKSVRAILATGEVVELSSHHTDSSSVSPDAKESQLATAIAGLCERHRDTISGYECKALVNRSGYRLDDLVAADQVHLARLMAGSEGTLAIVTEATLQIDPLPNCRRSAILFFDSLDKAARAALEVANARPSACDLMDRRHINLAREADNRYDQWIPSEAEAVLLVEQQADTPEPARDKLRKIVDLVQDEMQLAAGSYITNDEAGNELFWEVARRYAPTLQQLTGNTRPLPCIEDIAIPPDTMPVFLRHLQDSLKRLQITASVFAHAGHGQFHIRPFLNLSSRDDMRKMESLANLLYEKVWALQGTISGEHGDGFSRTPFLAKQFGPLTSVFRELKYLFDPQAILNPGKSFRPSQDVSIKISGMSIAPMGHKWTTSMSSRQTSRGSNKHPTYDHVALAIFPCHWYSIGHLPILPWQREHAMGAGRVAPRPKTYACARSSGKLPGKKPHHVQRRISSGRC